MPTHLLTEATWLLSAAVLAAAAISSITRSLVALCQTLIQERSRTTRLIAALKDSPPRQRAEIIRACGHLETRPTKPVCNGDPTKRGEVI